jgi:hypothetical protein
LVCAVAGRDTCVDTNGIGDEQGVYSEWRDCKKRLVPVAAIVDVCVRGRRRSCDETR